jgi:hypothetical protein
MEPVAGQPQRIVPVKLIKALGVPPLVVVDAIELGSAELLLDQ